MHLLLCLRLGKHLSTTVWGCCDNILLAACNQQHCACSMLPTVATCHGKQQEVYHLSNIHYYCCCIVQLAINDNMWAYCMVCAAEPDQPGSWWGATAGLKLTFSMRSARISSAEDVFCACCCCLFCCLGCLGCLPFFCWLFAGSAAAAAGSAGCCTLHVHRTAATVDPLAQTCTRQHIK